MQSYYFQLEHSIVRGINFSSMSLLTLLENNFSPRQILDQFHSCHALPGRCQIHILIVRITYFHNFAIPCIFYPIYYFTSVLTLVTRNTIVCYLSWNFIL